MRRTALLGIVVAALAMLMAGSAPLKVAAGRLATFAPPATITVKMYQLLPGGAATDYLCFQGSRNWGCTVYCTDFLGPNLPCSGGGSAGYPFSTATVTVNIEGQIVNGAPAVTNRYLHDVVPQETGPAAFHETAIRAQVIAARTYAYWFTRHPMSANPAYDINNSASKQVFVPYKFDTLTTTQQTIITTTLQDRYYLSQVTDDEPIFAEYSADAYLQTVVNPDYAYLSSVPDPISSHPDIPGIITETGAHQRGLSQHGASRWARGNLSYNTNTDLGAWSVSWPDRYQILAHYYTGIHVRNAVNNNAILTPDWRGNVLQVKWSRPRGYPDGLCSRIEVWLQNTGTGTWYGADQGYYSQQVGIGYCWNGAACVKAGYLPRTIAPGGDLWVTLLVPPWSGSGALQLDLYRQMWYENNPTWFSSQTPSWPRQAVGTFSAVPGYCTRLPHTPKVFTPIY